MAIQMFTRQRDNNISLKNSLDNLEKLHNNTVKNITVLQKALGELDLNESEDAWKTQYIQQINDTVNGYINSTNPKGQGPKYYGDAFTETSLLVGKVLTDPSLQGRIREQAKYKEWKKNLEDGVGKGLYSRDVADMYLEKNSYQYYDKYEGETDDTAVKNRSMGVGYPSTGEPAKIVGGVGGTYNSPTKSINIQDIFLKAAASLKPSGSTSDTVYYVDKNGNYTTDVNNSINGLPYYKTTNGYEGVDTKRFKDALNAAINSTPGARASLEQDLNVGLWKASKDENYDYVNSPYFDSGKMPLSIDEYINSLVDESARSLTWGKPSNNYTPLIGMQTESAILKKGAGSLQNLGNGRMLFSSLGDYYNHPVEGELYNIKTMGETGNAIKQYAVSKGITISNTDTVDDIYDKLQNPDQSVKDAYRTYKNAAAYLEINGANSNTDKNIRDAYEMKTALDGGFRPTNENNQYLKNYDAYINDLFVKDGVPLNKIYLPTRYRTGFGFVGGASNTVTEQQLKQALNVNNLSELGIGFEGDKIYLTKQGRYNYSNLINAIDSITNGIESNRIYYKNNKGQFDDFRSGASIAIRKLSSKLQDVIDDYSEMTNAPQEYAGTYTQFAQRQVNTLPFADYIDMNLYTSGDKKEAVKEATERLTTSIKASNIDNADYVYLSDENGVMQSIEKGDKARRDIWEHIKGLDDNRLDYYITDTGDLYIHVRKDVPKSYAKDMTGNVASLSDDIIKHNPDLKLNSEFSIMVPGVVSSELREATQNNPGIRGKKAMNNAIDAGMPNIPMFGGNVTITPYGDYKNTNTYTLAFNDLKMQLNKNSAEYLIGAQDNLIYLFDEIKSTNANDTNSIQKIQETIYKLLAPICKDDDNNVNIQTLSELYNHIASAYKNF